MKNSMNKFNLFVFILFPLLSNSQMRYAGSDGIPRNREILDLSGQPIPVGSNSGIEGTPLLQSKWAYGVVVFENGATYNDSSVNYSLFDDKLFFKRNEKIYPVNYAVKEFSIENVEDSRGNKVHHFKNGFPEMAGINKKNNYTFYEILFEGNSFELLKWKHKKIEEIYNYGGPLQTKYSLEQQYFIYFPIENKIVELGININLKELRKKIPAYSNQIETYHAAHKLNLKKDEDLIQLFLFLDSAN